MKSQRQVLNVSRSRKDPEGNYVAILSKDAFDGIINKVIELELYYETTGNLVVIKGRSWSKIQKLINYAREVGIEVLID